MSNSKLSERTKAVHGVINADVVTPRTGATFYDASGYRRFRAIAITDVVTATKVVTVELLQATDAAGAGAKLLGTLATYTAPAGNGLGLVVADAEVDELDVENGFKFVGVRIDSDNGSALRGAVVLELGDARFNPTA
jgi:hypothetical protein